MLAKAVTCITTLGPSPLAWMRWRVSAGALSCRAAGKVLAPTRGVHFDECRQFIDEQLVGEHAFEWAWASQMRATEDAFADVIILAASATDLDALHVLVTRIGLPRGP